MGSSDPRVEPPISTYGPRTVRPNRRAWNTRFILPAVTLLVTLLVGYFAAQDVKQLRDLEAKGQVIEGKVVNIHYGSGKGKNYYMDYEFEFEKVHVSGKERISSDKYRATSLGDPVSITALPSDPTVHRVGLVNQDSVNKAQGLWALGFATVIFIYGLMALSLEWQIRTETRILRDFAATRGAIVDIDYSPLRRKQKKMVAYRYRALSGPETEAEVPLALTSHLRLKPGQPVTVLVDPAREKPPRLFLTLSMVEVEDSV